MTLASTPPTTPPGGGAALEPAARRAAVERLYEQHADFIWRLLRRSGLSAADAEDALHEVFLVAHRRLDDYVPARGAPRAWLAGIAGNVARAELRKKHRTGLPLDETLRCSGGAPQSAASQSAADGVAQVEREHLRRALGHAVAGLSPEQRLVFELFELDGVPCGEIAALEGVPEGTVYSRLHHARRALRRALSQLRSPLQEPAP